MIMEPIVTVVLAEGSLTITPADDQGEGYIMRVIGNPDPDDPEAEDEVVLSLYTSRQALGALARGLGAEGII